MNQVPSREYWRQVAVIVDGKRLNIGSGAVMQTEGSSYVVSFNGKVYQRGTSNNFSGVSPAHSDVTVTEGANAGTSYSQIYQRLGDVLLGCGAKPGASRPTEFKSEPGSGHTLSVWVRIPEREASQVASAGKEWLPIVLICVLGDGAATAFRENLEPMAGYWGGLAASWVAFVVVATLIGLAFKSGWRKAVAISVIVATGLLSFGELAHVWEPALGAIMSRVAAVGAAALLTTVVAVVVGTLAGGFGDTASADQ